MGMLECKIAVITGGTRGFGLALARAFTREGAKVVIASRSRSSVDQALKSLRSLGSQVSGISADVVDLEQVRALAEHAMATYGRFDIWVNNAGISAPYGPTVHVPPHKFTAVLQTNVFGVYYGSLVAMHHFLPHGRGKLINILGRGDRQPVPMQNAYASSKTWIRTFTLALAKEYKDSGVGVYAFNPGLMETELLEQVEAVSGFEGRVKPLETVMRLWAKPPDLPAQKAVWLASSATDGKTGLVLRELGLGSILAGVLRQGVRALFRRPPRPVHIQVTSVPSAFPSQNE